MLIVMDDAEKFLKELREDIARTRAGGPKPVRWNGYVVHAMGNRIWLVAAGNSDEQSETRN
jgi:hypothetical protein